MGNVKNGSLLGEDYERLLRKVGGNYVTLEREIRIAIDHVVGPVCAVCQRVCCKASYCQRTLRNPWYRFLFKTFNKKKGLAWERREPPPGLGAKGCEIRAGRYAYCYSYNCRKVLSSLETDEARKTFQEISDILKNVGLNFMGKRHLTDVRDWQEITPERLRALNKKIEEGTKRFHELRSLLFMDKPGS